MHVLFPHLLHVGNNLGGGCSGGESHAGDGAGAAVQKSTALDLTPRFLGKEMESHGHKHPPTNGVRTDHESSIEGCWSHVGPITGSDGHLRGVGFDARVDTVLSREIRAHLQNDVLLSPSRDVFDGGDCVEEGPHRQVAVAEVSVGPFDRRIFHGHLLFPVPAGVHPVSD